MNKYEDITDYIACNNLKYSNEYNLKNHYQVIPVQNLNSTPLSHEVNSFILAVKEFIKNGEFENLLNFIDNSIPMIVEKNPKIIFWCLKCLVLNLKKQRLITKANDVYNKFLFPFYNKSQHFRTKINAFKVIINSKNVNMSDIIMKIDKYSEKFVNLLYDVLLQEIKMQSHQGNFCKSPPIRYSVGKLLCENRYLQILSKLDLKDDDSCLSDLEDDIMKVCQSENIQKHGCPDNSLKNTEGIRMTDKSKIKLFEIKKEPRIYANASSSIALVKYPELLDSEKNSMEIEEQTITSMESNINKIDFSVHINNIPNLIKENSPFENFSKYVEQVQENNIYQPLKNIVLDTEFLETDLNSRKTSDNQMDVEEISDQADVINFELERESIKNNSKFDFKIPKSYILDPTIDNSSNRNVYNKPFVPRAKPKENLKNVIPFLREFKPKFLKKENIDKKILRKFRNFVKEIYKKNSEHFKTYDKIFWGNFSSTNLLPPMIFEEGNNKIEFKSFNSKYLIWLFSKNGCVELYKEFSVINGEEILQSFINDYDLINNMTEIGITEKLKYYIFAIPEIYSKNHRLLDFCTIVNDSNLLNTTKLRSEDYLVSYLGLDKNYNNSNTFNLKNFGETSYSRCGQKFNENYRSYNEDYENFSSYVNFADPMNTSFDSIQSVE